MRKIASVLLAGFFLLSLSCRLAGSKGQGYIVYSAVGKDGEPLPELVVLDASGNQLRRITLPSDEKNGNIYTVYDFLHPSHRALVYTQGGINYLIDVASGNVKTLIIPGTSTVQNGSNSLYECPRNGYVTQRWTLLCSGNTPYLVNLETAKVYDVLSQPPVDSMVPFKTWSSPDETYFAFRTDDGTFILSSADPNRIRRLDAPEVNFSSDSKRVAYVRSAESQGYEVIVENVDGSKPGIIHASENSMQVAFIPKHNQVLIMEEGKTLLLSLSSRNEQEYPVLGLPRNAIIAPNGQVALVSYNDFEANTIRWQRLDLKRGVAEEILELEGYQEMQVFPGQRWVILYASTQLDEQAEIHMMNVDLQTGSVQSLATLEGAKSFQEISVSPDGIYHTGIALTTENLTELWLLDLLDGKARRIAQDAVVSGSISPDGKRLVVFSGHREGEQYQGTIVLQDTTGKILKTLGEGYSPFWVWP